MKDTFTREDVDYLHSIGWEWGELNQSLCTRVLLPNPRLPGYKRRPESKNTTVYIPFSDNHVIPDWAREYLPD